MIGAQIGHVFRKEVAQLLRNRDALRILLVAPFVQMLAFGYAATTDVKDIPFLLVDLDRTAASRALVERFTGSGYFRLVEATDNFGTRRRGRSAIGTGSSWSVVSATNTTGPCGGVIAIV